MKARLFLSHPLFFIVFMIFYFQYQIALGQSPENSGDNPVLFSFDDTEVHLDEFLYVYQKNNVGEKADFSESSVREYLELYINFRLKVKEAEELGLDTVQSLLEELNTYRDQLARSYLFDKEVIDKLVKEAYERMKWEVKISHIFVRISDPDNPQDTLEAYKKIKMLYNRIKKGEDFATLARQYSEDDASRDRGGEIGYITALQTLYPIETAAYTTPPGQVSKIIRSSVGYHLIKVHDKRPYSGKITVAQILLKVPKGATSEQEEAIKKKAEDIYQQLKAGADWNEMVEKYSEDKYSKKYGGKLPPFTINQMYPEFEAAAFALKNDGDISTPVRTELGYHIIKRISKEDLPPFDDIKEELKTRIQKDSRFNLARQALLQRIKKDYGFKEYLEARDELFAHIEDRIQNGKADIDEGLKEELNKPLITIGQKTYTQRDFLDYIITETSKKRATLNETLFNQYYEKFVEDALLNYEKDRLEEKYPEFKALMKEYRDGILLFELMDKKVWSKAIEDTAGLRKFYESHKNNYMWGERVEAVIYTVKDAADVDALRKKARKKKVKNEELIAEFNPESKPDNLVIMSGIFEKGEMEILDKIEWKPGLSENITNPDGSISFVKIIQVIPPQPKTLDEARGYIVSDYQEYLEKQWIEELRKKYPVKVNEAVLTSIFK